MKSLLLALVSAAWFSLGTSVLAAESGSVETANPGPGSAAASDGEQAAPPNKGKSVKAKRKKPKPFTPEDLKRAEVNKKKVEWWQMPKPPVFEPGSSTGRSHVGH
ncbi:MAG: hypothetical protein L0Y38_05215 [Methylococcaceae bacterium]|nr:hypothetical protein [Methylococcaceae bacterium]MCI0733205.1 hypothetical protein [Methylococcaceae bacterium]